ncbi:bifunctional DNA-formamidopyrimidine glycosylase/DNA-(apurinic or apyrimidinic site) lyase [Thermogemmatispora sp.]|uniref:bifunctional DNA-formamidopyrimidine glycosylase/DNA-(apurinic or apyrimidinic site) lyase n=1 Tax=Thermogemmatispora sp. TaxID=1968838 RepID=UPI001DB8950C|nr:bifunctional DNA-formamidopyrimidine glycosylase/DNA-(apurinic or apyrimidinic site) lyase [Thermogemmatispora sp.]MBX5450926.1 bifunctional DNA-formamidopyrimidine glycosylase/DNA-(apurinic or apyrimidinic site) lyase [Thermogemmatispora sp.]
MPELPEVEYTARQVRAALVGACIIEAQVFWERSIARPDSATFCQIIVGRRIEGVRRRGKLLLLDLSGDYLLTIHRRMTGNLLVLPPGWRLDCHLQQQDRARWERLGPAFVNEEYQCRCQEPAQKVQEETLCLQHDQPFYCRVCFTLADGRRLLYNDLRKFGKLALWPRAQEAEALAGLGLEPLAPDFTNERLWQLLQGKKRPIKQVLLEQTLIAGLGNIYADEALYLAAIHPLRRADTLNFEEVAILRQAIVAVLQLGIEHGGTSFNDYRGLWGEAGSNYAHMQVYQRTGQACRRCGTPIQRIIVAQRGTHFCPTCQPAPY